MSDSAFDGFYTPAPADLARDSRWPWIVVAAGAAIVVAGAVAFSGGAADHHRGIGTAHPETASPQQ